MDEHDTKKASLLKASKMHHLKVTTQQKQMLKVIQKLATNKTK